MDLPFFTAIMIVNLICARAAQIIATEWGRSPALWIWMTILIGPAGLALLMLLPRKTQPRWVESYNGQHPKSGT